MSDVKKSVYGKYEDALAEIDRLKIAIKDAGEVIAHKSKVLLDKDAAIDRILKQADALFVERKDSRQLIAELADALTEDEDFIEHQFEFSKEKIKNKFMPLIQKARAGQE